MRMETASVVLRDFAAKDAESLCRIVREPEIARFMHEWVERCPTVDKARAFIDAQQALKDAADIQARRWLAIALPDSDGRRRSPSSSARGGNHLFHVGKIPVARFYPRGRESAVQLVLFSLRYSVPDSGY